MNLNGTNWNSHSQSELARIQKIADLNQMAGPD